MTDSMMGLTGAEVPIGTKSRSSEKPVAQRFVGIDVGLKGAVAWVSEDGSEYDVFDMPVMNVGSKKVYDLPTLHSMLSFFGDHLSCHVEKVSAMSGQGVTSMFRFGEGYGIAQMAVIGAGHRLSLVRPQTWKAVVLRDTPKSKGCGCMIASQLFPRAVLRGSRGGVKDGRCDALMIAEYGRRKALKL